MKNKRKWLGGILVIMLVFGMIVVGCDLEEEEDTPDFDCFIVIDKIPSNRNGESFTMSLIHNGITLQSKDGKITGDSAEVSFIFKDVPSLNTITNWYGTLEYTCYLGLKIGNDSQLVSKDVIGIPRNDDGTVKAGKSLSYENIF